MIRWPSPAVFRLFVLIALFFAGQYAALLHASEHPFHGEQDSCALYLAADHHEPALLDTPTAPLVCEGSYDRASLIHCDANLTPHPRFRARAPPARV